MGFLNKTGVDLANETPPNFPIVKSDLTATSFGYSVKLTPLQILAFYNAVANNGRYMKPKVVKEFKYNNTSCVNFPEIVINKICSDKTLQKVQKLLEGVVERGTAHNIANSVYKIAGKTGTARIWDEDIRDYVDRYVASFCGYFPADDPKYSCIVVEYNMKGGEIYGSQVAAPVFKEIADKVYATRVDIKTKPLKMPDTLSAPCILTGYRTDVENIYSQLKYNPVYDGSGADWVSITKNVNALHQHDKVIQGKEIPDVTGMTAKDAVYIVEQKGLNVVVKGAGRVVSQIFNPQKNQVVLTLSF
jgi:cell division protein FtsI (penicillin-binding protein 3)